MRAINRVVVHCSDSDHHDTMDIIRHWHVNERGWSDVGYHVGINKAGQMELGRDWAKAGAHCKGLNSRSIGVCVYGKIHFTEAQFKTLEGLLKNLMAIFNLTVEDIYEHRQFNSEKTCPNFSLIPIKENIWKAEIKKKASKKHEN
tara:strand:+ start:8569 stop:9003 length:435 start_codon:yes stop_codon:yes gene_type:complete